MSLLVMVFGYLLSDVCSAGRKKPISGSVSAQKIRNTDVDPWEGFDIELNTHPRYQTLREDISRQTLPFTLEDIGHPKSESPKGIRSVRLYLLLNRYTDFLYAWLDKMKQLNLLDDSGHRLISEVVNPDEQFRGFIKWNDPLLVPALAHFIQLVRKDSGILSEGEKQYMEFRLRWIDEIMLPEGMKDMDWENEYKTLQEKSIGWRSLDTYFFNAQTRSRLYKKAQDLISHGQFVKKFLGIRKYAGKLAMQTVWDAFVAMSDSGILRGKKVEEPFLKEHVEFVFRAVMGGDYYDANKRDLTAGWLQLTAIEQGCVGGSYPWRQWLNSYQLPVPSEKEQVDSGFFDSHVKLELQSVLEQLSPPVSLAASSSLCMSDESIGERIQINTEYRGRDDAAEALSPSRLILSCHNMAPLASAPPVKMNSTRFSFPVFEDISKRRRSAPVLTGIAPLPVWPDRMRSVSGMKGKSGH